MDQQQQPQPQPSLNPPPSSATSSAADPPHQPQPPPQPSQPQPQSPQIIQHQTTSATPPSSIHSTPSTAIPNPNPKPLPSAIPPPQRPPHPRPSAAFSSPWQQHSSQFTGSFGHPFGGTSSSNVSQARPMMRSVGSSSLMRPSGISVQHQQRPLQSSLRPTAQFPSTQNFQGHSLMRVPAGSSTPSTPQTTQSPNQPWLSSGAQAKPPLPSPWHRPQISTPSLQPRPHISQQHHSLPTVSQQQHASSPQVPQTISSHQQQEHFEQQVSQSRPPQSLPHQQQDSRSQSSANQKPSSVAMVQPSTVNLVNHNKAAIAESDESGGRILGKRSINDLVNQIDLSEKLEPDVEDILADIAEDFVDSIATFGCSLAKHRKSDTLEAKDILLHLERTWNMTLPGFSGDDIKNYKKPLTNEVHKERLAVIKKSVLTNETANAKHTVGQTSVNAKGNVGKVAGNILGSPNVKI